LQCAALAEVSELPPTAVAAALLHDIGHLLHAHGEHCTTRGINDCHEELGVRFLSKTFGPEVTEPIRLHVAAKRYLTSVRPDYLAVLSPSSLRSLELQGGPMTPTEIREFEANPYHATAVKVREHDDGAKVAGLPSPRFAYFRKYLEAAVRAE
jgi:predicted HD phosphohydrolase